MLDKNIPYIPVLMIKDNPLNYPKFSLPDGYAYCMYKDGYENHWAEIETAVGDFNAKSEAVIHFNKEFMKNREELYKRCLFIRSKGGDFAATCTLWHGNHFGREEMYRLHWLSVHPAHQGKGLAKAIITRTMDLFYEMTSENKIYLTTQTWSYKAINIYLSFGFRPYMGERPLNWKTGNKDFEEENKEAWNIINKKVSEYIDVVTS